MRPATLRISSALIGLVLVLTCTAPALADDSEVFTSTAFLVQNKVRPNILFIIDTSGSMETSEDNYDPTATFTGPCRTDVVYYKVTPNNGQADDTPPDCKNNPDAAMVLTANNRCKASATLLTSTGVYTAKFAQFVPAKKSSDNGKWGNLVSGSSGLKIECQPDDTKHGDADNSSAKRAANTPSGWDKNNSIDWKSNTYKSYTLYSPNYANWYYGDDKGSRVTRLDIVRTAANGLVDTLEGVNLGIARYDSNAQGGMITEPVLELDDAQRTKIKATLKGYDPAGNTPLSETLYEAGLYFAGMPVDYGLKSKPVSSVASARTGANASDGLPANYKSPMQYSCQKNYIVYLTDGLPTSDKDADAKITAFDPPGEDSKGVANSFSKVTGTSSCSAVLDAAGKEIDDQNGACLDDMAGYLNQVDMRGDLYGIQNVTTFIIGFGDDVKESKDFLSSVAKAGGSNHAYTASNSSALTTSLQDIFAKVADDANLTFTSPTVSVNAFNRAQNLNDLYVSVFSPNQTLHWDGNLKKYKLIDSVIYGQDPKGSATPAAAVNPETGFFFEDAKSYWSDVSDGFEVTKGGAASKLPDYAETGGRTLVTYLGSSTTLTDATNAIKNSNTANLTNALLGVADDQERSNVIAFSRGEDISDIDGDDNKTENNHQMGDPMHARPAVVIYGGTKTSPDVDDAVAYVPTNDGYLHAFDTKTGVEKWAFVPPEFLKRLKDRFDNPSINSQRTYALDGDVRVFKYDVNRDGIVTYSEGDRVYVYFGFGRGGSTYYALDVSQPGTPKLMWKKNETDLNGLAYAWSTPALARVNVKDATQNDGKYVLIFGGGYDADDQEGYFFKSDGVGNRLFMLDAVSGALLWSAGPSTSSASLKLAKMTNSIPGAITVIDTDGNGFADRMYAGDMGGRVWRFDITNGAAPTSLVTGGVFASLGAAEQDPQLREDTRRFYYAPDVALFAPRGAKPYYNLAIGSGYRGHPLEEDTHDRFYALRDYQPFTSISQGDYDDSTRAYILDADLVDVTTTLSAKVEDGSPGWKLELRATTDPKWLGEKVLAEAITVNGVILFPTFQPNGQNADNPCLPATLNRVYAVTADNARPFADNNHDGDLLDLADRATSLKQGGIAAGISIIVDNSGKVPDPNATCKKGDPNCACDKDGKNCKPIPQDSTCLAGVEILKTCVPFKDAVRTFWNRK